MNIFIKGVCFGLGFLVVVLLIAMVGSINDSNDKVKKTTEDLNTINMAIFEDSFIKSCIGEEKTETKRKYCKCSYDYIISILGEEETVKEAHKIPITGLSPRMMEVMTGAIDKCL